VADEKMYEATLKDRAYPAGMGDIYKEKWQPGHRNTQTAVNQRKVERMKAPGNPEMFDMTPEEKHPPVGSQPARNPFDMNVKCEHGYLNGSCPRDDCFEGKPDKDVCSECGVRWGHYKTCSRLAQIPPALSSGEVRVIDPHTGGQKGAKLQRFSLIPFEFLWALATHYGRGARKYEDRNWERGYKWSLSLDAAMRHLTHWLEGERYDAETGSHHLIAVIWHFIALWFYDMKGRGTNDITQQFKQVSSSV